MVEFESNNKNNAWKNPDAEGILVGEFLTMGEALVTALQKIIIKATNILLSSLYPKDAQNQVPWIDDLQPLNKYLHKERATAFRLLSNGDRSWDLDMDRDGSLLSERADRYPVHAALLCTLEEKGLSARDWLMLLKYKDFRNEYIWYTPTKAQNVISAMERYIELPRLRALIVKA
jgi:hypothetical protein